MSKKPDFTQVSANLLTNHKTEVIKALQTEGVMLPASASNDQIIKAYLVAVADSSSFRKNLTNLVYPSKNADGDTPAMTGTLPAVTVSATDQSTATKGSSFLNTLGDILSSKAFGTVLDTAATSINNSQALKQQANQIKLAQLNLENTQAAAAAGQTPAGATAAKTGMSTGAVVGIIIGVLAIVGVVILVTSKKKGAGSSKAIPMSGQKSVGSGSQKLIS